MCSKCYRDHVLKSSQAEAASSALSAPSSGSTKPAAPCAERVSAPSFPEPMEAGSSAVAAGPGPGVSAGATAVDNATASSAAASSACAASSAVAAAPPESHPPANRCHVCKRRVGLTGFKCRCEGLFCSLHRYSDKHDCSFDYKAAGREAIAKASPVIKADKIDRF
ncbi:hypothetical protein CLOM_g10754 [Closterium sp. NIES-68]|nr:hypothetical protein CLOM_g10754 [Closterium sp. NIES-68]GJP63496.1 hypothetical protein CLOP_g20563 [Closterium sp. NIES-67]